MSLLSAHFLLFAVLVFVVYCLLDVTWQNRWLIFANVFFFASWGWDSLLEVIAATLAGLLLARGLRGGDSRTRRDSIFLAAFSLTIAGLAASQFLRRHQDFDVAFPVGFSFYSLQLLGYVIEVGRGQAKPARGFGELFLFSSFFPTAVMGPIGRFSAMSPQFNSARHVNLARVTEGVFLIAFGIFKKLVIADRLLLSGRELFAANPTFNAIESCVFLFLSFFALYADFSGYTDIARGLAKIFGFEVMQNFRQPYFAKNLGDLVNRWHISLTSWVRDFIYWPVLLRTKSLLAATFTAFAALAFWHGVSWNRWAVTLYFLAIYFVYWVRRRFVSARAARWNTNPIFRVSASLWVILVVTFSYVVLKVDSLTDFFSRLSFVSGTSAFSSIVHPLDVWIASAGILIMVAFESFPPHRLAVILGSMLFLLLLTIGFGVSNSMYFLYMRY
jgi:alginate O-acetyltransferase complex protein AlgI